jgi:hypothetical protein
VISSSASSPGRNVATIKARPNLPANIRPARSNERCHGACDLELEYDAPADLLALLDGNRAEGRIAHQIAQRLAGGPAKHAIVSGRIDPDSDHPARASQQHQHRRSAPDLDLRLLEFDLRKVEAVHPPARDGIGGHNIARIRVADGRLPDDNAPRGGGDEYGEAPCRDQ